MAAGSVTANSTFSPSPLAPPVLYYELSPSISLIVHHIHLVPGGGGGGV